MMNYQTQPIDYQPQKQRKSSKNGLKSNEMKKKMKNQNKLLDKMLELNKNPSFVNLDLPNST